MARKTRPSPEGVDHGAVDLLVEGLPPERLFEAMAEVSRQLGADVDLVPSEAARPAALRRALSEGRILHG